MIRFFVILFCLTITCSAQIQEKGKKANTQHNFLFVIDSSLAMAPRKTNTMQLVRQMVLSGFEKQIQSGDSIDIWVYDEENHINAFPPQIWEDTDAKRIAIAAAQFIDLQQFKGRSRFETVARDLEALLPHTKQLLVIILTDAAEPFSGIPLDLDINQFVATEKRRRPQARQPFLISIAAVNGRYMQWAAYCDEADHVLANLPPRPKPTVVATKPTKPTRPKEPEKKRDAEQPIIFELPPGARVVAPPAPKPDVIASNPTPDPVQPQEKKEPEAAPPPATNLVAAVAPTPTNAPVVQAPKVENSSSNSPALAAKTSAEPQAPTPPASKPQPPPQIEKPVNLAAVSMPQISETKFQTTPAVSTKPVEATKTIEAIAPQPPVAPTSVPNPLDTAEESRVEPVRPSLAHAVISPLLLYGGVALSGFAIIALGALLMLKRAKARQGGSIISRSLLQ